MDIGISIVVTFVLVLVNGYFSMSEMALVNAKHVLLQKEADEGDARAGSRARRSPQDSGQFLATIQVAITLVGFFASAAAATNLSDPSGEVDVRVSASQWLAVGGPGYRPGVHHAGGLVSEHRGGRAGAQAHGAGRSPNG